MLRIVAWRLLFELKNMQTIFSKNEKTIKYFAFGANLDPNVLINTRRIKPLDEKEFILKDYALRFSHPSAWDGEGFASIDKAPGEVTYGKLYTLREDDARRLDYYELVPFLNRYQRVTVEQDDEEFFFYHSQDPRPSLRPWHEYRDKILAGFSNTGHVPQDYLDMLKSLPVQTKRKAALEINFVYKTSKKFPEAMNSVIRTLDQKVLTFFVRKVKNWSPTERLINV